MEDTFDSSAVPSLNIVVEEIFSSCNKNENDEVPASVLIEFMKPHLSNHVLGLTQLRYVLDPNNDNPSINRRTFYEAMRCWTAKINAKLFNLSFKDYDLFDENCVSFHQSTPKPSLEPSTMRNSNELLDFSNLSATSFTANMKDNSIGMDKLMFMEERYQELEHKHMNTVKELTLVKSQLATAEEQYAELKQDLDRTNKRLMLEQQVNADLQKSMEHNDDFKEEVCNTKKEKEHVHKMLLLTKRENVNLIEQMKSLEYEKELLDRKLSEMQRKEEQKKKEFVDLQTLFALYEDENKLLKKAKGDLEEKLKETKASLEHYSEVTEHAKIAVMIMKNKIQALTDVTKKKGINLGELNFTRAPSDASNSSGTPVNSRISKPLLKSSTPLKNIKHSWLHYSGTFSSPKLQRQLSMPISPSGLDTPQQVKSTILVNDNDISIENWYSPGQNCMLKGALCDPKKMLVSNMLNAKSGRSKNLPPAGSVGEFVIVEKKRCFSEDAESSLQSVNSTFETIEDLDLSSFSDNLRSSNGQDLLSELQGCKFLDNHNKCYIEEHAELLKIVKEHDDCSQIIALKEKEIEIISTEVKSTQNEFQTLLNKHNKLESDIRCVEEHLNNTKIENEKLNKKNNDYIIEIENLKQELNSTYNELKKNTELENENLELIEEIDQMKEKKEQDIEKINELKDEKESLQSRIENLLKEKDKLCKEKDDLFTENMELNSVIEIERKDLNEMRNLKIKNEELEKEVILLRLDQEQNREEIKILSNKLLNCKDKGKYLLEKFNSKIQEQNSKIQFLRDFNNKLQEYVGEIQDTTEVTKTKLNLLLTYVEDNYVNVKYVHKGDDEDSTSTGSNDSNSYHNKSKQISHYGKRSNYEKQQLIINKLEEKIEELEKELSNEKTINEKLRSFEYQINNLKMEKINYEEEKNSILRELEATKYDLCMKDQMLKQSEEKHKFDLDNLNQSYEKEIELSKNVQIEAQKNMESRELILMKQVDDLKTSLYEVEKEKKLFESMLEKQGEKIIILKKALSDISTSTEEAKNFETLVTEKESMLNFNRELLRKANNSLKDVENRCLFLQLLLDKCKMVLTDTVNDVIRSSIELFNSYKDILDRSRIDSKVIHQLEILETEIPTVDDFTEKEVWIAHNHLTLISKLLRVLVSDRLEQTESVCGNIEATTKIVSKFTLTPSKLKLQRLPSCDPDISSSSIKDNESDQLEMLEINTEEDAVKDKDVRQSEGDIKEAENEGSTVNLRENDSETNWLDPYSDNLREEMNNRKITEKKFTILSLTWKSNFENTKKKYRSLKHRCSKMKNTYLHVLLQIVTYIKNHSCHQEQRTLIQALKLIEKLKDLLFDVFKLAEQYGASRQDLHSIKCWNLIVEYVNKLHQENRILKLYQCTSVQLTHAPNDCSDTSDLKKTFRSVGVGDSVLDANENTSAFVTPKRRKCSSLITMTSIVMCFFAMCILFVHMECIRNGNETIMCPLDLIVSIKKAPPGSTY